MAEPVSAPRMTPMLKQYYGVKKQYPDALLFFRMGDFFELFFEDAKIAAKALGIALTSRSKEQDMPMAGVPVRSADRYLHKLIQKGHTVVVCDQVEDPKQAKGIVERAVTRIVTPGTLIEDALLEGDRHNWLAALAPPANERDDAPWGLAWLDLSTAHFEAKEVPVERLSDELNRLAPAELLISDSARERVGGVVPELADAVSSGPTRTLRPDHDFDPEVAERRLCERFKVQSLAGFGVVPGSAVTAAAGATMAYVAETQRGVAEHVTRLQVRSEEGGMLLDRAAIRALELLETTREGRREGTLLWCLDRTCTAAGGRRLRDWLLEPRTELGAILPRQEAVAELVSDPAVRASLRESLEGVYDIARITARLAVDRCSPRDLSQLRDSLHRLPALRETMASVGSGRLRDLAQACEAPADLPELLDAALVEAPPLHLKDGGVILSGYSAELDQLRSLRSDSKQTLAQLQQREIERTGIPTLKVGFNSVFGYYIEITHLHKDRVPTEYIRKQTLKNAERYITPELKEYETRILSAEGEASRLEAELFEQLRRECATHVSALQELSDALADLDVLASLAEVSADQGWCRPELDDGTGLEIREGRHPVLTRTMGRDTFVPNDCELGGAAPRLAIITGPNMAGKSTYLRQTALLVLMAQIGSFVPALSARIGVVDRIFTRVGASDDLVQGHSTFMVEMTETANILHHATERSLVVLDEIGRGTGTFDGMALARALAEHLAETTACRTLFATHYHQLTALSEELPSITNLSVSVREWGEEIIFLHRIQPGGTDRSYGIHVARLAGVPGSVLVRARGLLEELEGAAPSTSPVESEPTPVPPAGEAGTVAEGIVERIRTLDLDRLTPLQALQELYELRARGTGARHQSRRRGGAKNRGPGLFGGEAE